MGTPDLFLGIDVGTGGVRALAATGTGEVVARQSVPFEISSVTQAEKIHEQVPDAWWNAVCQATSSLVAELRILGRAPDSLKAVTVDGTSGTLVCLGREGNPLRPAIMYNDGRATAEAEEINSIAQGFCEKLGYRFAASYALAKALWICRNEPEVFEPTAHLSHQADFVAGRLTGKFGISDYSNALKTGYDLIEERWPAWMENLPGVTERLPRVVPPGTLAGKVTPAASAETGLPEGLDVVTGATDGTAACIASGMKRSGDYNTTLGTTLVFKSISRQLCRHPDGLIYSHKLPGGWWLPGAASNTGAEWIGALFPELDVKAMDAAAGHVLPTSSLAYPLVRRGERFPFLSPLAEGFCVPQPGDDVSRYAAYLQGTALVERLAYQVMDEVSGAPGGEVFSTGGGSQSNVWMQSRADATGRVIRRPACPESAFGSAVLAAAGTTHRDLWQAVDQMVRIAETFSPDQNRTAKYNDLFDGFCLELRKRGYL